MKSRPPLRGYNHNLRYRDRAYHVQTEDSGVENPHLFSHLYHKGVIVASAKYDYSELVPDPEHINRVRKIMQTQHKGLMKKLRRGDFDQRIIELLGSLDGDAPRSPSAAANLAVPKPVAPEARTATPPTAAAPSAEQLPSAPAVGQQGAPGQPVATQSDVAAPQGTVKPPQPAAPQADNETRVKRPSADSELLIDRPPSEWSEAPAAVYERVEAGQADAKTTPASAATSSPAKVTQRKPGAGLFEAPLLSRDRARAAAAKGASRQTRPSGVYPVFDKPPTRGTKPAPQATSQSAPTTQRYTVSTRRGTTPPAASVAPTASAQPPQQAAGQPPAPQQAAEPTARRPKPVSGEIPASAVRSSAASPPVVVATPAVIIEGKRNPTAERRSGPTPSPPANAPAPKLPSLFGADIVSERSLDEVILGYLAEEDSEGQ